MATGAATIVLVIVTRSYVQLTDRTLTELKKQHNAAVRPILSLQKFELFVNSKKIRLSVKNVGLGMAVWAMGELSLTRGDKSEILAETRISALPPNAFADMEVELARTIQEGDTEPPSLWTVKWRVADVVGADRASSQNVRPGRGGVQFDSPIGAGVAVEPPGPVS